MIIKHSNWELGAYLFEYNGDPIPSVNFSNPIHLLRASFLNDFTEYYVNEKFFYYNIPYDAYFLKTNVEIKLKFHIPVTTSVNNNIYMAYGYYVNPLQIRTLALSDSVMGTTGNSLANYKAGYLNTNTPNWIISINKTFFFTCNTLDTITFSNNPFGFFWTLMLRQI